MTSLTQRQKETLEFVRRFVCDNGYCPTVRDVCLHLGLSSKNFAHKLLSQLKEKGYITWQEYEARTIRPTEGYVVKSTKVQE